VRTRVLVVASQTASSPELIAAVQERGDAQATLLVPAAGPGFAGREAAQPRLEQALSDWRAAGLECRGVIGDQDPLEAVHEVWEPGRFDEVIVSTLPGQSSKWLRSDLPHRVARLTDVPVMHVVALSMRPERPHGPLPVKEKPTLGPLSVLSWGGPQAERGRR
jgi:hypothetical protein